MSSPLQIDKTIELGERFKNVAVDQYAIHSIGIDFGFSCSQTAIVATEFLKEEKKIHVIYAEQFEKANPQDLVDISFNSYRKRWNTWFYIDGANRAAVNLMKVAFSESLTWDTSKQGKYCQSTLQQNTNKCLHTCTC